MVKINIFLNLFSHRFFFVKKIICIFLLFYICSVFTLLALLTLHCILNFDFIYIFFFICSIAVAVDGRWSAWSDWSECEEDCKRYKRRRCDNPSPANGGSNCSGREVQVSNCSGGLCKAGQYSTINVIVVTNFIVYV